MQDHNINIHQIYFAPEQLDRIEPVFIPYDNSASPRPDEHEFYVFRKAYLDGHTQEGLQGYVSWKFQEKTGIDGSTFLDFCSENKGYDVYFINPFPIEICFGNIWQQGEMWIPGISGLTQALFDRCGIEIDLSKMPRRLSTTAYCNYWVGSPRFWDQYMSLCLPVYNFLQANPNDALTETVLNLADPTRKASYFAFIFERLFSTLLAFTPGISYAAYTFSRDELRQRYPRCYADFLADLQEHERAFPDDPEPLLRSPRLLSFLDRQERAIQLANHDRWRRLFNQQWQRWSSSSLRQRLQNNPETRKWEGKLFYILNPGYVHWRKDRPV